jgi:hypothetical protein
MCYKLQAVESSAKHLPEADALARVATPQLVPPSGQSIAEVPVQPLAPGDDVSRYCPVCSQRLISRRCKLICAVCGYYMSCADYY